MRQTVESFLEQHGRNAFASETGFSQQVISRAVVENMMPASWFVAVREFCARRGGDVPEHLFRWAHKSRHRNPSIDGEPHDAR